MKTIYPLAIMAVVLLIVFYFWKKKQETDNQQKTTDYDSSWWNPETGGVNPEWMSPVEDYSALIAADTASNFNWTVA
jgi:hypothetical protein